MSKVIAIANQKGGAGKTTTTASLGFGLARMGKKVLLIDADPQGSLSISLGIGKQDMLSYSLANIFDKIMCDKEDEIDFSEGLYHHEEGVDLMPCNITMCDIELRLTGATARELVLRYYVENMRERYDYILIDCMPSLQILPLNAFACADSVIIPVKPDLLNVKGLEQLMNTIKNIKTKWCFNPRLSIEGIVFTQVDTRRNNDKEFIGMLQKLYGSRVKIFNSLIPLSVKGAEVSNMGISIYKYDPKGKLAESYFNLTQEVLANE
ncbi:MAG: ParA family protein [Lachnospiraceae bacterium]|nr:ParA family protein [Lachnospiraceae bacterium]